MCSKYCYLKYDNMHNTTGTHTNIRLKSVSAGKCDFLRSTF